MEKVFGIYEGCIFEGGGVRNTLYHDKDEAIAEAEKLFEEKEKRSKEMFYEKNKRHYEQYKWKKCDKQENRWHNTVDEIKIVEFEIK